MNPVVQATSKVLRVSVSDILQNNKNQRVIEAQEICALILRARQNSFASISIALERKEGYAFPVVERAMKKAKESDQFALKLSRVWRELGEA
jgi:hypothetical protein